MAREDGRSQGLLVETNPLAEERLKGGPEAQMQEWPGLEKALHPPADHGEHTYRGAGKLSNMRALITGGDSGIGKAIAIAFAREGADVAISYFNEHEDARDTVHWIENAGRRALPMAGDIRDEAHCRRLVDRTVQEFGGLNILVNNAAYHIESRSLEEISTEQLEQTFRTNVFATIWLSQAAVRHMKAGDTIIHCGSVVALTGHPTLPDYAATKAAIHNLTQTMAQQLAERGIRVNCVAPGPVWTPLITATRDPKAIEGFGADTFWRRPAQPAEIAPAFVFLASADARFCSGEIIAETGKMFTTR
ncbi:MAG: SDR family oxidoreductase [Bryobacteraceae bacterium]